MSTKNTNEWDEHANGWDANEQVVQYAELAFAELNKVSSIENKRILDFGCGTGLLTDLMAPKANHIVGLDTSEEMIAVLDNKNISNVSTISEPLTLELIATNELLSAPFDIVVASSVCAFLPDYEGTLKLLKSLLVPGGVFVQWDWLVPEENMEMGLSKTEIERGFKNADLYLSEISEPFAMSHENHSMPVVMVVGKAMFPLPKLQTNRLELLQLTEQDWPMISFLRSDPEVNAFVERPAAETKDDAIGFIAKINRGITNQQWYYWKITEQISGKMIGTICIWNFSEDQKTAEVGFDLHPDFQRKGFMSEALSAVTEFGFEKLGLTRIEAYTHRLNSSSKTLLEKSKFKLIEGKTDPENINNLVYALYPEE